MPDTLAQTETAGSKNQLADGAGHTFLEGALGRAGLLASARR
jgi:hypothetical protein